MDVAKRFGEPGDAEGVETGSGFVEEQDGGAMDERAGNSDALAHAAGKSANEGGTTVVETDFAEKFFSTGGGLWNILEFGEEDEIFFRREFVVDHGGMGNVSRAAIAGGFRGGAGEGQLPCCGTYDAGGDPQERGFAGTVAASKDDTFAGSDFERDAAESEETAETFIDLVEEESGWR
jgi:hypothetical protein